MMRYPSHTRCWEGPRLEKAACASPRRSPACRHPRSELCRRLFSPGDCPLLYRAANESIKATEKAIRLNPRHPDVYLFDLAASYRLAGRYEEALALGKKFQARQPHYPPVHFHLAVCYAELDQLEEARAEGAEILRLPYRFTLAWFERFWPVKDPAIMERILAALRKPG